MPLVTLLLVIVLAMLVVDSVVGVCLRHYYRQFRRDVETVRAIKRGEMP